MSLAFILSIQYLKPPLVVLVFSLLPIAQTTLIHFASRQCLSLLPVSQLLLHPLAQPLFDHALIVQVPLPGQSLDSSQHSRVDSKRNGHGISSFGCCRRGYLHEAQVHLVLGPKGRFRIFAVKQRDFFPRGYCAKTHNQPKNAISCINHAKPSFQPICSHYPCLTLPASAAVCAGRKNPRIR